MKAICPSLIKKNKIMELKIVIMKAQIMINLNFKEFKELQVISIIKIIKSEKKNHHRCLLLLIC